MARVETKVQAASLSAAVSGVALWALTTYVFKGSAVPAGLVSLVYLAVPAVLTGVAGYLAPHTPRPVTAPVAAIPPPGPLPGLDTPPAPPPPVPAEDLPPPPAGAE